MFCIASCRPSLIRHILRPRAHDRSLPERLTHLADCSCIIRVLFYQVYWLYLMHACFIVLQLRSDRCQIHGYVTLCYQCVVKIVNVNYAKVCSATVTWDIDLTGWVVAHRMSRPWLIWLRRQYGSCVERTTDTSCLSKVRPTRSNHEQWSHAATQCLPVYIACLPLYSFAQDHLQIIEKK